MTDERNLDLDRRSFLKHSAVGAFGIGGVANSLTAGARAQDGDGQGGDDGGSDPETSFYGRRMVFPYPERLNADLRQQIIIMTDQKDQRPDQLKGVDQNEVDQCNFGEEWPPQNLNVWEGIIVDWKNAGRTIGFYGRNPTVEATQLVERNTIFVDALPTDIPLGTPFVVSRTDRCPGDLIGVEAIKVPGIEVQTGPGESTGESTGNN
ncbi:hypothetical protein M0R88_03360 [Halorussus gelatinilyticus]|uniref:Twin-arginine translocation signal domain-containing protein n=1 Tax=Halorussus gelatinilyticus TaxID=2937524 RepID=A0A8U0IK66_9EURY|nr:hypothetical protein [Halorussus gelatinilyticus]UPW01148.1 hypothetical protein M0R88_03360 [Halorussus gelatinilyticus]